jgi:hypothetical protein
MQAKSKYVLACPPNCTLRPDAIGEGLTQTLMLIRANGAGAPTFARRATELLGRPIPTGMATRHFKHFKEVDEGPGGIVDPAKKLADLEILDLVIQRGAANSQNWKPSIKDTIEAMKLKMQMTGNSAFDDLIKLFDGADADELLEENPRALGDEVEVPEEEPELPEPVL